MKMFFSFLSLTITLNIYSVKPSTHSSYPFPAANTFASFCDHTIPVKTINPGNTIFVDNFDLKKFFTDFHPKINHPYILVTHNGWHSVPGIYAEYLKDPKIIAWFGKNVDRNNPKLFPIPIGLTGMVGFNSKSIVSTVQTVRKNMIMPKKRDKLIYFNMTLRCNIQDRGRALELLSNKPFFFYSFRKSFQAYMNDMSQFKFAISPCGLGVDCHRTWEALLVDTIPIISRSGLHGMSVTGNFETLFDELPVLIVDDWDEITEEFLMKKFHEIHAKKWNKKKLFAEYWFNKIKQVKQAYLNGTFLK